MFRDLKGTRMQIGGQEQLQTKDDSGKNKKQQQQQHSRNREQRSILHQDTIKQTKLALGTPHINPN
jgi:hypothetical protein